VQMLFFNSAVNHARERQRRPVISGMWTWGGGTLPAVPTGVEVPAVFIGEHPLLRGLARHTGREYLTLAQWRERVPLDNALIYYETLQTALLVQDLMAWTTALLALDADLAVTAAQLRSGALAQVVIDACQNNQLQVIRGRALRWKFWQRRRFFEEFT
ncbi:MAG: phosphoglycerate mutase, partial [Chromatium okenii]|nr:phosphoglycerate mutase [Chromatium okenii]